MRVLVWMETHHPVIGGIQTAARQYLPALAARGMEVAVVASHYTITMPDVMIQDNVPVHRFQFYDAVATNNVPLFMQERQRITKFVCEFAPDVVHIIGFGPSDIFYLKTRQRYSSPFIFTIRNEDSVHLQSEKGDSLLRQLFSQASWVTTASKLEAGRIAAILPEVAAKISCVYHGLTPPQEPLAPPPTVPRLLCIGRIVWQKNFGLAVQAFARILPAFPDARLIFAGEGTDRAELEQVVNEMGVAEQVDFLGWVQPNEIPALINQATAVILPSRHEGLPLTAIQTAQMARPMIATRVSGTPEVVIDGETGLLVPSEDVEALAKAIYMILSDPARAAQLGEAAHARIYEKFGLAGMVDSYTTLYQRVIAAAKVSTQDSSL